MQAMTPSVTSLIPRQQGAGLMRAGLVKTIPCDAAR